MLPIDAEDAPAPRRLFPFTHGQYRITTAWLGDLPAIAALEAAVFREPLSLAALLRLWCRPGTRYLVARRERRVCAYFGFELHGPLAHVIANATADPHRRHGLATVLVRAGGTLAARAGARWLQGEVRRSNHTQLSLLQRQGWQSLGVCPRFFGDGEDAVLVLHLLPLPPDD